MFCSGIKGNSQALGCLERAIARDRIAHAYLFTGPEGVGKRTAAVAFAKTLNCAAPGPERPCGACPSCVKIAAGSHPDVRVVTAQEDATAIGIDQIRNCIKDASLKPYEARVKAYIIDGAGRMKHEAQSAFLKTLEEPSSHTVIILIAERPETLFPTIVSRCESVVFRPLGCDDVKAILVEKHGVDHARAHVLAGIAAGQPGVAFRYAGDEKFFGRRQAVIDGLLDGTFFERDAEKRSREDLAMELGIMLTWFRDILVSKTGAAKPEPVNIDRREAIARESKRFSYDRLDAIIGQIMATDQYIGMNVNPKLAMNVLGMEVNR